MKAIKLAGELSKKDTGNTFYILDEPTTGLHFEDIRILMDVINKLVDKGNTVLIIEHNLDVIKLADYIIDIGLEGGKGGGQIVAEGTPELVAKNKKSITGKYILQELREDNQIIHYNGAYHSDYYQGILWYIQQSKPLIKVTTISTVS